MVNLKTTTVSYKVHKLIRKPEEEWSIVPNAQEAIIDENTWLRVQELRKNKRRPTATGKTSLFSGLVFCADCGSKLHFCAAKSLKTNQEFFRCANYKSGRGECTIHYIRNVAPEQIVSVAVSDLADFVTCHESFFLQMIGKRQSAGKDRNIRSFKSDITAGKHRMRFHDLRHSCASLLLANGVPLKQIQEWLGHSDFSTTANIYAHLDYRSKISSAQAMETGLALPEGGDFGSRWREG